HVQSTAVPAGTSDVQFLAVSCINTTSCEAVGSYNANNSGTFVGLGAEWNGTSWQLRTMPTSAPVTALSCTGATFCEAVGADVAATSDGTSWNYQTPPAPSSADMTAVS